MKKTPLLILLILASLFFQFGIVFSDEIPEEGFVVGEKLITGSGVQYAIDKEKVIILFEEDNATVNISGNLFTNIQKHTEEHYAYIHLDKENGEIIRADFTTDDLGGTYTFDEELVDIKIPPNMPIFYNETGLGFKPPPGYDFLSFENLWGYIEKGYIKKIEGENIELPNGSMMTGTLHFEDGQAYIAPNEVIMIDDLEIKNYVIPGQEENSISVFFNNEECKGNCVSIGLEDLFLSSIGDSWFEVEFHEENPYLRIDQGDEVSLYIKKGATVNIENRDTEGFIPNVTTRGKVDILEDSKFFEYDNGNVVLSFPRNKGSTTSPIELYMLNEDGSPAMGGFGVESLGEFRSKKEMQGNKIIIDNFNRFAVISEKEEQADFSLYEWMPTEKFSSRLRYNYLDLEDFAILFSDDQKTLRFSGLSKGNEDALVGRLRDYYNSLPPKMKESLLDIRFMSDEEFERAYGGGGKDARAFATHDGTVVFRDIESFSRDTFRHETAHQLHFLIKGIRTLNKEPPKDNFLSRFNITLKEEKISEFEKKWKETLSRDYDVVIGRFGGYVYLEEVGLSSFDENVAGVGPGYGFMKPYGSKNIMEDVATFQEKADIPESFEYVLSPEHSYSQVYWKKLDLLYEYGFISEEEYNAIMEAVELNEE